MNNLIILNKETYETIYEKNFLSLAKSNYKDSFDSIYSNVFQLVRDIEQLDSNHSEYFSLKMDSGKILFFRKSLETKFSILIISDKNSFKNKSLIEISKSYLEGFIKFYKSNENSNLPDTSTLKMNNLDLNKILDMKKLTKRAIEDLTYKFLENLIKNKLFTKFVYYNYNTNFVNSIMHKKTKLDSTSLILYNSGKDFEKMNEMKDTMFQKSTIKEKELNFIEYEKKSRPPCRKNIFVKKFNNAKTEQIKKKNTLKYFGSDFFIEKYFLSKNTMIHYLFNNIFVETENKNNINEKLNYPINSENEHILLFALDIYEKAQSIFAVSKSNSQEYVDVVNYIELNLTKTEIMCKILLKMTRTKLILVKYKALFILLNIEIYDEKNLWSSINFNTNFYKEIESLFAILYNEASSSFV